MKRDGDRSGSSTLSFSWEISGPWLQLGLKPRAVLFLEGELNAVSLDPASIREVESCTDISPL